MINEPSVLCIRLKLLKGTLAILYEMCKFIETHNLPTLNHEGVEDITKMITSKDIDSVIKIQTTPNNNKKP